MEGKFMQNNKRTRLIVTTAMFAALSAALMFFEFPLPFLPPFLKLDLSDIPVLIGAFVLGPIPALAIVLIKDLIHLLNTQTAGVGELADFLVTGTFALTAGYLYKVKKIKYSAVVGSICGIITMTIMGAVSNIYIILPFYEKVMGYSLKAMGIKSLNIYIIFAVVPFNLIKGIVVTVVTLILYKRLSEVIFKKK
jgi:riboflavin transporter FmnP